MTTKMIMIVAAFALVTMPATDADAKHKRHARPAKADAQPIAMYGNSQGPARMIEVRPGLWISSYGCIADDGYGRYTPCDLTESR
jgi:hypothetical protein